MKTQKFLKWCNKTFYVNYIFAYAYKSKMDLAWCIYSAHKSGTYPQQGI